jgi:hypothetical protein
MRAIKFADIGKIRPELRVEPSAAQPESKVVAAPPRPQQPSPAKSPQHP